MKMKIYLSGPMTGLPDFNRPAFNAMAKLFIERGYDVVNPVDNGLTDSAKWEEHMRAAIKALMDCTHIVMLPGYEKSRGAMLEMHIARALGLCIRKLTADGFMERVS
jgi:hypothetical protein